MFCVIYEFDVMPGKEDEFKVLWHNITLEVRQHDHGLGSRLHKIMGKENKWIAYAQWPKRETWLSQAPLTLQTSRAGLVARMKSICHSITTLYELEVVDDLLVHN